MKVLGHSWVGVARVEGVLATLCLLCSMPLSSGAKRFLWGVCFGRQILIFAATGFFIKCLAPWYTFFSKSFPFIFRLVWNQGANLALWKFALTPNLPLSQVMYLNKPGSIWYSDLSFQIFPSQAKGCTGLRRLCDLRRHPAWRPLVLLSPPEFPGQATGTLWPSCPAEHSRASLLKTQKQILLTFTCTPHVSRGVGYSGASEGKFGWRALALVSKPAAPQTWNWTYIATLPVSSIT